ncbi:uncharacterized protein LOC121718888 isoform X2 [Alosa sapidissima]|uniref:uncharacterized protein LOC121718888 isoform X2 n=1 Tax=Alosa sapidissima TaxID=34773 RepID=UPI001C095A0D|nr:uncharacterized protein LOC121718888 isoform X2 [Alosa sapidissima]
MPYPCPQCGQYYIEEEKLKRHQLKRHQHTPTTDQPCGGEERNVSSVQLKTEPVVQEDCSRSTRGQRGTQEEDEKEEEQPETVPESDPDTSLPESDPDTPLLEGDPDTPHPERVPDRARLPRRPAAKLWMSGTPKIGLTAFQVFSCSLCPKSYTAEIYLHKHMKLNHHEEYTRMR